MMQINDETIFQLSKQLYNQFREDEFEKRLDHQHLDEFRKKFVKPLYPNKSQQEQNIIKYGCFEACCKVDPGDFCCCVSTKPDNSFRKFGLGICLYFKFLKHAALVFFFIAILSLVSCLICYWVSSQNQINIQESYTSFLFSSTLGSFSSQHVKCQYAKINSNSVNFKLQCPYGVVSRFGAVFSNQTINNLLNCKTEIKKYQVLDPDYALTNFGPTQNLNSVLDTSNDITITFTTTPTAYTVVSYSYQCLSSTYKLGLITIKSQYLLYIVVSIDLLIYFVILLFYCSQSRAEKAEQKFFKCQQLSLNNFSIKIKNFSSTSNFQQQFNFFVHSLKNRLGDEIRSKIVQVKIPQSIAFLQYQQLKDKYYNQIYELIDQYFFDHQINPNLYQTQAQYLENCFKAGKYQKFKSILVQNINAYVTLKYYTEDEDETKKKSIYLVLDSMKTKRKILALQDESCFTKRLILQGRSYKLEQPPAPDLIIWSNKGKWTWLRLIFSWLLTFGIIFCSYLLFGYIQYQQNQLLSKYNFNIDCGVLYQDSQLSSYNNALASDGNYFNCYCKYNLVNFQAQKYSSCSEWRSQYATYLAIPIVISILLVVYNVIVSSLFKLLTSFECHTLRTNQLFSYTIKRAFLMVMNLGLIMILLNINYRGTVNIKDLSFLFLGKYSDITDDWSQNLGSIIILTMIFNISFPIIQLLMASFFKCLRKCWDRRCCMVKTSAKTKSQYLALYSNDIYPLEERYAYLISLFMITLVFNGVIPCLNIILMISIFLLYYSDKLLIFKVYQTPLNYDSQLHSLISKTIYISIIFHMILQPIFLSESNLIAPNSQVSTSIKLNSGNERINSIIHTNYMIPYVIVFVLMIVWTFFNNTIVALVKKCGQICKKQMSKIAKYKLEQDFYQSLNGFQITRLKLMTEQQISKLSLANKKSKNFASQMGLINLVLNDSKKDIFEIQSEHEALLRATYNRLKTQQQLRKKESNSLDSNYLIGLPGYEIMFKEEAFQQNKKNIVLTQSLNSILRQEIKKIKYESN